MSKQIVFYTNPRSRGSIVRWMLEELGAPYRVEALAYGEEMKSPAFLALNPMGKVPTIRHGDVVVTETAAICAYLADAFPQAGLAPPVGERGAYYRWLFFAAGPLEAAISNRLMGFVTPADKEMMVGYGNQGAVMDALEQALGRGAYVTGERFSAADVYVGAHVQWGLEMPDALEKRPAFLDYWGRLKHREAKLRADELDDALQAEADGEQR